VGGALTGAAGLWELAGAVAVVIVTTVVIVAARARPGGTGTRQRG
jgi:hypothetical protein